MAIKFLLIPFCSTHRSVYPHTAIIRDASCNRWELTQRPITLMQVRERGAEILSPKWDDFIKRLHSGLRMLRRREGRKTVRVGGDGWHQGNRVFHTQQDWCTHELRDHVSMHRACTGSSQMGFQCWYVKWTQGPIPNQDASNVYKLAKEKSSPMESDWVCEWHLGHEVEWMEKRGRSGRSRGRGNRDQNILYFKYKVF